MELVESEENENGGEVVGLRFHDNNLELIIKK
jgi:CCR4-NOT transcriptional regulation complex NOT5 subunit